MHTDGDQFSDSGPPPEPTMTLDELVEAIASGTLCQREGYAELCSRLQPMFYAFASKKACRWGIEPEDLWHDFIVKILVRRQEIAAAVRGGVAARAYLQRMLVNLMIDLFKSERRRWERDDKWYRDPSQHAVDVSPESEFVKKQRSSAYAYIMRRLSREDRETVEVEAQHKRADAAKRLGITPTAWDARRRRARRHAEAIVSQMKKGSAR